ncbi:PP2C family protein-serine/threonine phosphatase [Fervidobacterium thailandense]|uniref:PPM-type phosphatase domain-containing protein n=1 Tax=Fervidobacterium thailandense TaxID=1008305 RepID=A0A1E3G0Y1_9BACT|nr:SpoIIE family protein phosphatase [Fervidobacterium thailandense]ODN29909.1 hypothetical protein A4H02_08240 [Fervidobacterium thailandense]
MDRILFLTSDLNVTAEVAELLRFVGYDVVEVSDVSEVEHNNFELAILYSSHLQKAYEWARYFRTSIALSTVPIILMIPRKEYHILLESYQVGISDFVEFPVIDVEIISKVALHIELKKSRERIESLYRELKENLELSRQLQKMMLPPHVSLHKDFWITSNYAPSQYVGGDVYDFASYKDSVLVYLADISGHGVQSALLCSAVKSLVRYTFEQSDSLLETINELSLSLKPVLVHNYLTGIFLKISSNGVEYLNCGHPNLIMYDGKRFSELEMKRTFPIGLFDEHYGEEDVGFFELQQGITYILYTDGIYSPFEKMAGNSGTSWSMFKDFLDRDVSGLSAEAIPFYVPTRLKMLYSEFPDDYSIIAFGRNDSYCYLENEHLVSLNMDEKYLSLLYELKSYACGENVRILMNKHPEVLTIVTENVEVGPILKKLPASVTLNFDDVTVINVF